MKPNELRAMRKREELAQASHRERLATAIRDGRSEVVVPELIPSLEDHVRASRDARQLARQAERQPRGRGRDRKLDELVVAIGRLVWIERVMELDEFERCRLTPGRLWKLSMIGPQDLQERLEQMRQVAHVV